MKLKSTRNQQQSFTLSNALLMGLARDGGLFVPEQFPTVDLNALNTNNYPAFCTQLLAPFFKGDILESQLESICQQAFTFEVPFTELDEYTALLELFHGPTLSFKDFGARFLSQCLSHSTLKQKITILVATSGDTGSAVASAFYQNPNVNVAVLFPKNKVSPRQKQQITCWGDNVQAIEIDGSFDDCQQLVKTALADEQLKQQLCLNTANSINIGRLLPQMTYYAFHSLRWQQSKNEKLNVVIPSGNLGHITACLWAKKIGFPLDVIAMATNANPTMINLAKTAEYRPAKSVETLANAMDVGAPSNFERVRALYHDDLKDLIKDIPISSVADAEIIETIKQVYKKYHIAICPHTATAFYFKEILKLKHAAVVATAHPAKFPEVTDKTLGIETALPEQLSKLMQREHHQHELPVDQSKFQKYLKTLWRFIED